jgi:hypothetical protein
MLRFSRAFSGLEPLAESFDLKPVWRMVMERGLG